MTTASTTTLDPSELPAVFPDLTPVPQDDGPHPVCSIAYSEDFVCAYDYLRAALRSDELSERFLRLTGLCLKLNPANYTVWHYRRKILSALSTSKEGGKGKDDGGFFEPSLVASDLLLAAKLGGGNPKNYQIWYHRRALLEPSFEKAGAKDDEEVLRAAREELSYVRTVLGEDAKNYHAWSHRQWINRTIDSSPLWSEEKDFTHALISDDPRNNSAWNQRWFVMHYGLNVPLKPGDAMLECQYTLQAAALDPHNESPWRYLIGVVKEQEKLDGGGTIPGLVDFCQKEIVGMRTRQEESQEATAKPVVCPNLLAAHADILEMMGTGESLTEARRIVHNLAVEHDTIRRKYWLMKEHQLESSLEQLK